MVIAMSLYGIHWSAHSICTLFRVSINVETIRQIKTNREDPMTTNNLEHP